MWCVAWGKSRGGFAIDKKMEQREFTVGEHMTKGTYNKCMVCLKKLKIGDKIVLCPIQGVRKCYNNVIAIPIHTKCYWIEEEASQ